MLVKEKQHVEERTARRTWPPFIAIQNLTSLEVRFQTQKYGLEALMKDGKDLGVGAMGAHGIIRSGQTGNLIMLEEKKTVCSGPIHGLMCLVNVTRPDFSAPTI